MSNDGNLHVNHRERLRTRAINEGLQSFYDHQILELLLFYALARIDTNDLAHRLIERFGSLAGVFKADRDELLSVPGIGSNTALLLSAVGTIHERLSMDPDENITKYKSMEEIAKFLANRYVGVKNEKVYIMLFNNAMKLIDCIHICDGTPNSALMHAGTILKKALLRDATVVVVAHNHPDGMAIASTEDIIATKELEAMLNAVGIELLEHLIIAGKAYLPIIKSRKLARDPDFTTHTLKNPAAYEIWDDFYGESGK